MAITFKLDMAERACSAGAGEAKGLFKPNRAYTLRQMVEAGLAAENIAWMIVERVRQDGSTMELMRDWAKACCKEACARHPNLDTPDQCTLALQSAMRSWAKDRPTSKGARQWTFDKLFDLILSGRY
jgi:hypothetical protein